MARAQIERARFAAGDFVDREFDAAAFVRAWPGTVYHDEGSDELVLMFCPDVGAEHRAALVAQIEGSPAVGGIIEFLQLSRGSMPG